MRRLHALPLFIACSAMLVACSKKEPATPAASAPNPPPATSPAAESGSTTDDLPRITFNPNASTGGSTGTGSGSAGSTTSGTNNPTAATGAAGSDSGAAGELQPAEPLYQVWPFYPFSLRMQGTEGTVDVGVLVDESGNVVQAEVVSSTAPRFNDYAVEALRLWKFRPAMRNEQPVRVAIRIPIPFASEYGSLGMSPGSPLANLAYNDGNIYMLKPDGRYALANQDVQPLLTVQPFVDREKLGDKVLRASVRFTVSIEGQVIDPKISESSNSAFDQAVLEAVRFWQFVPRLRDGKPVPAAVEKPFVLNPPSQSAAN